MVFFQTLFTGWELLRDPSGRDHFLSFLEKEYATENLLFVEAVWNLKKLPSCEVAAECKVIWNSFMARHAEHPVNVDSKSYKMTEENMRNPDRCAFRYFFLFFCDSSTFSDGLLTLPVHIYSI